MFKRLPMPALILGVGCAILAVVLLCENGALRAFAQPPDAVAPLPKGAAGPVGRYQIAAWGSGHVVDGRMKVASGLYIIDSETGDIYSSANDSPPHLIGSVAKKK